MQIPLFSAKLFSSHTLFSKRQLRERIAAESRYSLLYVKMGFSSTSTHFFLKIVQLPRTFLENVNFGSGSLPDRDVHFFLVKKDLSSTSAHFVENCSTFRTLSATMLCYAVAHCIMLCYAAPRKRSHAVVQLPFPGFLDYSGSGRQKF